MKEHPILFSSEMVRAILEGRKTQTRRIVKPDTANFFDPPRHSDDVVAGYPFIEIDGEHVSAVKLCPYGQPGDRLWVREKFAVVHGMSAEPSDDDYLIYATDASQAVGVIDFVKAWRPSIFMPRIYSRITLEIVDVRVERVQDISDYDAVAEGIEDLCHCGDYVRDHGYLSGHAAVSMTGWARENFSALWDSINAKRGYSLE